MILKLFTIYDSKVEAYFRPFYAQSIGGALRDFEDAMNDASSHLHSHLEDYTLFHLGEWDDSSCTFFLLPAPTALGTALSVARPKPTATVPVAVNANGAAA